MDSERQIGGNAWKVASPTRLDRLSLTNQLKELGVQRISNRQGYMSAAQAPVVSKELHAKRILNRALAMTRARKIPFATAWTAAERDLKDPDLRS